MALASSGLSFALGAAPHWEWQGTSPLRWAFELRRFNQTLDHFNAYGQQTFAQRYLLNSTFWGGAAERAPLFFFTGAEGGDVTRLPGAYGHVLEMAERLRAMVVFMEARFFGESLPFGPIRSFDRTSERLGLLSVEHMLLDYVNIVTRVRAEFDPAGACPTLAFGGSLAGTLSAMLRLKYPTVVDMALASSAPLRGYAVPGVDPYAWRKRITDTWETFCGSECPIAALVRSGFEALRSATPTAVKEVFRTCEAEYEGNGADAQAKLWGILEGSAEFVYPPAASTIPQRCRAARGALLATGSPLSAFAALYNYDGAQPCMNLTEQRLAPKTPGARAWDYLACTEIVHPIGCNNVTDFFPPGDWTLEATGDYCSSAWGVRPLARGLWIPETFGFFDAKRLAASGSRIAFAYGGLDPWHVFQVSNSSLSEALPVINIPNGSHCADMGGSRGDGTDTPDMLAARAQEEAILRAWLAAVRREKQEAAADVIVV